jgi:hypothetical protein
MNILDILLLLCIAAIIIWAISYNLNATLNTRLSNVAINIPPITIPPPQITVKIQKPNGLNDSYDVYIENQKSNQKGQVVSLSPIGNEIEGFSPNLNDVSQTRQVQQLLQAQQSLQLQQSLQPQLQQSLQPQLQQSLQPQLQQVQQEHNKNSITLEQHPEKRVCNNSLSNQKVNAYGHMFINSRGINEHNYPMCNDNSYVDPTCDDITDDYVVNQYRQYQQFVQGNLEDPILRGYNVNDYDDNVSVIGIGKIDLKNGEDQPKPEGYIFPTSPAYNR